MNNAIADNYIFEVIAGDPSAHIFLHGRSLCGSWSRPTMSGFISIAKPSDPRCNKCLKKILK